MKSDSLYPETIEVRRWIKGQGIFLDSRSVPARREESGGKVRFRLQAVSLGSGIPMPGSTIAAGGVAFVVERSFQMMEPKTGQAEYVCVVAQSP